MRRPPGGRGRDEMISGRIPLEEVNDAFDGMRKGEIARQVITFDS